jgi:hypothetical protein
VKDERIDVWAKLSDEEGDLMGHEAADEMHIATEPIQLRYGYVTPLFPCGC